jgi:hypothetical protein
MSLPDYYELPDGTIVFTEAYHLRRGSCCGSGCLHCPYDGRKGSTRVMDTEISIDAGTEFQNAEGLSVQCPFCFETFLVPVTAHDGQTQKFVYDCEICCHPIDLTFECDESGSRLIPERGN